MTLLASLELWLETHQVTRFTAALVGDVWAVAVHARNRDVWGSETDAATAGPLRDRLRLAVHQGRWP